LLEFSGEINFDLSSHDTQRTIGAYRIVEGRIDELSKRTPQAG